MKACDLEEVKNYAFGNLDISSKNLISLEGCPKEITGGFSCTNNKLISLEGRPTKIDKWFNCSGNKLTSLEGCPVKILSWFGCGTNKLTSFEYFPKYISGRCFIGPNDFTSFKDIDQYIEHIGGRLFATEMNVTSGYSDLFGIDGLNEIWIDNRKIQDIVNKYLPEKDLIEFQDEMIKVGFESYL